MENTTLGRALKIANLKAQRKYLEEAIRTKVKNTTLDGNPTIRYIGYIFPENLIWLSEENIDIVKLSDVNVLDGYSIYILTPQNDILLNTEENAKSAIIAEELFSSNKDDGINEDLCKRGDCETCSYTNCYFKSCSGEECSCDNCKGTNCKITSEDEFIENDNGEDSEDCAF